MVSSSAEWSMSCMVDVAQSCPASLTCFLFQLKDNKVFDVPVAVIAGNRPNYLYR